MNTHFEVCRANSMRRVDELLRAIQAKRMNASAFEGLMSSYLDQPAFSSYRSRLLAIALDRLREIAPEAAPIL